jgi:hypothetical protein
VPPRDAFDRALQDLQLARSQGNPSEAAARRNEARRLLEQTPAGSAQWASRVQNLAQVYRSAGWHADGRAVVQDALARANVIPDWNAARIQLLSALSEFWQQDGNLLKALSYREKAVAALEATPPNAAPGPAQPPTGAAIGSILVDGSAVFAVNGRVFRPGRSTNNTYLYQQLAALDRQLGRPQAAAQTLVKMRSLIRDDLGALAASYEEEGDLEQARTILQKQSAEAAAKPQAQPWEIVSPLQSIASLYERENRSAEAAATLEKALVYLDASSRAEARNQAITVRLHLAGLLQQSGQSDTADAMYHTLINQTANDPVGQQFQVLQQYANHLAQTSRGGQGVWLLKDYQASHSDLPPWQESNVLFTLSQIARQAGQKDLAEEYQRAAEEKQRAGQARRAETPQLIGPKLQRAQAAANQGQVDDAVALALDAIASSSFAPDGEQISWQIPGLAEALASKKAPDKGEQLFRALFPVLEARAVDNIGPLDQALQHYAHFLIGRKDRAGDASLAIDRYRESLAVAHGAETSGMVEVQRLRIELARAKGAPAEAVQGADSLLAVEESLSGATSAPYLRAAQTAAEVYRMSGQMDRALALYRQIVAIADLAVPTNDAQRGFVRMNAAMAFASARQFAEAERLSQEAIAVGQTMRPPRADLFRSQAEQIQRMNVAAQSAAPAGGITGGGLFDPAGAVSGVPRP